MCITYIEKKLNKPITPLQNLKLSDSTSNFNPSDIYGSDLLLVIEANLNSCYNIIKLLYSTLIGLKF